MKSTLVLTLVVLSLLTGCKNLRISSGEDDSYIHLPEELKASPPPPSKSLLPATVGNSWTYQLSTGEGREEKSTVATPRIINGVSTVVILNTVTDSNTPKAPPREELFQITKTQISHISSSGGADKVTLKPPMVVIRFPMNYDDPLEWQGGVLLRNSLVPSRGRSFLRVVESVTVPAGTFTAYRVDSVLETQLREGTSIFWTTRWFAPGVGIVKTRYFIHTPGQTDRAFNKLLLRYSVKA